MAAAYETSHFPTADDGSAGAVRADTSGDEFCGKGNDGGGRGDIDGVFDAVEARELGVVGGDNVHKFECFVPAVHRVSFGV